MENYDIIKILTFRIKIFERKFTLLLERAMTFIVLEKSNFPKTDFKENNLYI